jgi:hypothetical protein
VVETLVEAVDTPESIRGIRNFLLLTKFFSNIRPEILNSMVQAVIKGAKKRRRTRRLGFSSSVGDCTVRTPGALSL